MAMGGFEGTPLEGCSFTSDSNVSGSSQWYVNAASRLILCRSLGYSNRSVNYVLQYPSSLARLYIPANSKYDGYEPKIAVGSGAVAFNEKDSSFSGSTAINVFEHGYKVDYRLPLSMTMQLGSGATDPLEWMLGGALPSNYGDGFCYSTTMLIAY